MRKILFKGAQKVDGSKFLYWYEGSLVIETDSYTGEKEYYIQNESGSYLVIPETVGQYTGLTDKNGKKIFEGDILEFLLNDSKVRGKVFYSESETAFVVYFELPEQRLFVHSKILCDCKDIEVIGNIYDNPELLEVTEQ